MRSRGRSLRKEDTEVLPYRSELGWAGIVFLMLLSSNSFSQLRGEVINLNGSSQKDISRLLDGGLATTMNVNGINETLLLPYESYLVLDSISNITELKYYTANSAQSEGYTIRFLDQKTQQLGASVNTSTVGKYQTWTTIPVVREGVRFVHFSATKASIFFEGISEVQIFGKGTKKAHSIYPSPYNYKPVDLGLYAHGVNTIGDRIWKVYKGDTVISKVAKSVRFYWSGFEFDHYPETYEKPLKEAPLFLGRFGYDHSGNLLNSLNRWGIKPMMAKTGPSIKGMKKADAMENNKWLGGAASRTAKYIEPGANADTDTAWAGLAQQYKKLITLYGTKKGNANAFGGDTTSGQGTMDIFEWDNEPNGWWKGDYYHSPKQYYRAIKAIYNSGKQADPDAKIYAGALPGIDTMYWKALYFIHYLENGTANFPADGFNFNMYLNDAGRQQAGSKGISPEAFNIRGTMLWLQHFFNRHFGKPVQWTEFGYATDDVSEYDVDAIGKKTERQVQADWTLRLKAIVQSVPFINRMYYYAWFEDGTAPFNSMSMVRDSSDWKNVIPYPVAYAVAQEMLIEKNTPWFAELVQSGDTSGTWVTRKGSLYKLWQGTSNGSTGKYSIKTTFPVKVYTLKYDNWQPELKTVKPANGQVAIVVTEAMTWVEVLGPASKPPAGRAPKSAKKKLVKKKA